jgi:CMP-N-acetylneuraminic acid synthetase
LRRQDLAPTFVRNGECYALSREVVLKDPLLLGSNARMVVSEPGSINIDSFEDLERAQKLLKIGEDGILVKR